MRQFSFLKKYPHVTHGIFDKSFGNFSFNHGSKKQTQANRQKLAELFNFTDSDVIGVNQVHGTKIVIIKDKADKSKLSNDQENADGLITNIPNILLLIKTADCVPILMFDPYQKVIAAIHAGWKGAVEKIHLHALLKMTTEFNCKIPNILVGLGPAACKKCYGENDKPIQAQLPEWKNFVKQAKDKWEVDIVGFLKQSLIDLGLQKQNIEVINECTVENKKDWFSHRREKKSGETIGRFAIIIGLKS